MSFGAGYCRQPESLPSLKQSLRTAEGSERGSGQCVGMAVLPAPCCAGLKGQRVCLACCQACAQIVDCSDPSFCLAACGCAKPHGMSFELSSEGQESRRVPCTGPVSEQC